MKALRSGRYDQAQGRLKDVESKSYCYLGVLCNIYLKEHGNAEQKREWKENGGIFNGSTPIEEVLPRQVMRWAGLSSNNPKVRVPEYDNNYVNLSALNDGDEINVKGNINFGRNFDFKEIADLIEEKIPS